MHFKILKKKNKTQTHNAHTAFRIKTNRSSYLSPLIIWCSMRFFYALDTSLNSFLVAYAPSALHCLLLCCLLSKSILIKNVILKFMALTKKIGFRIFSQHVIGSRNLREITRSRILSWMPAIPHPDGRTCQLYRLIYASNNSLPYFIKLH